jgi:hypothetical protein
MSAPMSFRENAISEGDRIPLPTFNLRDRVSRTTTPEFPLKS